MAQLLVRNLDRRIVERLKREAEERGLSLEGHLREILTERARPTMSEARERFLEIQRSYGDRIHPDSVESLREDRYG